MNLKVLLILLILTIICLPSIALPKTKTIRVAIIDSGYNPTTSSKLKLCKEGHKDYSNWGEFRDVLGHGTHIANIIAENVKTEYCAIIIKIIHDPKYDKDFVFKRLVEALRYLDSQDVQVINISGGGIGEPSKIEEQAIAKLVKRGVKIFVAAGNNAEDLDENCNYFPACYALKIEVVGNLDGKKRNKTSNYGKYVVTQWQQGTNIKAEVSERIIMSMTGTSQATAFATAKYINRSK